LQQNYATYFEEIDELADAAEGMSDAALFLANQRRKPWQVQLLPFVGSVSARSVVTCNSHPAPSRFSACSKPQSYEVERRIGERVKRASAAFLGPSLSTLGWAEHTTPREAAPYGRRWSTAELATDLLPYMRLIAAALSGGGGRSDGAWACGGSSAMGGGSTDGAPLGGAGPPPSTLELSSAQLEILGELTSFGAHQRPLDPALLLSRKAPLARANPSSPVDEIEDDDD
jgi:hypothetical protein